MTSVFAGLEEDIKQSNVAAQKMKEVDYKCYLFLAEYFDDLETKEVRFLAHELLKKRRMYCDDMQSLAAGREPTSGIDYYEEALYAKV